MEISFLVSSSPDYTIIVAYISLHLGSKIRGFFYPNLQSWQILTVVDTGLKIEKAAAVAAA